MRTSASSETAPRVEIGAAKHERERRREVRDAVDRGRLVVEAEHQRARLLAVARRADDDGPRRAFGERADAAVDLIEDDRLAPRGPVGAPPELGAVVAVVRLARDEGELRREARGGLDRTDLAAARADERRPDRERAVLEPNEPVRADERKPLPTASS